MPNWCDNRVAIQGPPKLVMEVVERLESDERWFDFEGYLPTSPELLDPDRPREEHTLPDWYEWRREHWGVKWNARGSTRRGYGRTGRVRYRFLTAWGPPDTFLDHLAACHPELTIQLSFEAEPNEAGEGCWKNGAFVPELMKQYEIV